MSTHVEGFADRKCYSCDGKGTFEAFDNAAILTAIKGRKEGTIKSSMVSYAKPNEDKVFHSRCYYVWRLARFHGGVDMTMPVMASVFTQGDPFIAELDTLSDAVAQTCFGSNMKAAYRWGRALGHF